jgi:hypothetical protein
MAFDRTTMLVVVDLTSILNTILYVISNVRELVWLQGVIAFACS